MDYQSAVNSAHLDNDETNTQHGRQPYLVDLTAEIGSETSQEFSTDLSMNQRSQQGHINVADSDSQEARPEESRATQAHRQSLPFTTRWGPMSPLQRGNAVSNVNAQLELVPQPVQMFDELNRGPPGQPPRSMGHPLLRVVNQYRFARRASRQSPAQRGGSPEQDTLFERARRGFLGMPDDHADYVGRADIRFDDFMDSDSSGEDEEPVRVYTHEAIMAKVAQIQEVTNNRENADLLYRRLRRARNLDTATDLIILEALGDDNHDSDEEGFGSFMQHTGIGFEEKRQTMLPIAASIDQPPIKVDALSENEKQSITSIIEMFPAIDPQYVVKQLVQRGISVEALVDILTRDSGYPKLKVRLEAERNEERRRVFLDSSCFDMEEYLLIFERPDEFFNDLNRAVSASYVRHALVQLQNDFPEFTEQYLQDQLESFHNHYLPTFISMQKEVKDASGRGGGKRRRDARYLIQARPTAVPWPDQVDEQFFRELQYLRYQDAICETLSTKKRERQLRFEDAKSKGLLQHCPCCVSDDALEEEVVSCLANDSSHQFCRDCVKQYAEQRISEGRHVVTCMESGCDAVYSLDTLRTLLRPQLISLFLRRQMEVELRSASISNLLACPFCDFMIIQENEHDKIFRCQNPECLRESCRLCKESNHVPLKCDEVEKATETAMRTFVENKMAEAMIRSCPRCGKRIIKDSGCNQLSCVCGQLMCYVCKTALRDASHSHFARPGAQKGCQLHTPMYELHQAVAQKAGEEAKAKYLREHPNAELESKQPDISSLLDDRKVEDREGAAGLRVFFDNAQFFEFLRGRLPAAVAGGQGPVPPAMYRQPRWGEGLNAEARVQRVLSAAVTDVIPPAGERPVLLPEEGDGRARPATVIEADAYFREAVPRYLRQIEQRQVPAVPRLPAVPPPNYQSIPPPPILEPFENWRRADPADYSHRLRQYGTPTVLAPDVHVPPQERPLQHPSQPRWALWPVDAGRPSAAYGRPPVQWRAPNALIPNQQPTASSPNPSSELRSAKRQRLADLPSPTWPADAAVPSIRNHVTSHTDQVDSPQSPELAFRQEWVAPIEPQASVDALQTRRAALERELREVDQQIDRARRDDRRRPTSQDLFVFGNDSSPGAVFSFGDSSDSD